MGKNADFINGTACVTKEGISSVLSVLRFLLPRETAQVKGDPSCRNNNNVPGAQFVAALRYNPEGRGFNS
jgi:hypothetical protein